MMNRPTFSDVYDINPKTGALILGKNRLDDYATKFLNKYCKKALDTPMPLPVNEILKTMKLTVMEASLSRNMDIFGCCLLLDSEVEVFDREEGTSSLVFYPAGTVLLDPASEEMYGEGAKRNTLIHEALHWEKDKTYFEILKVKNALVAEKLYPIMCRHTETFYEPPEGKKTKENEVRWLEWQAHRLAPRILMPVKMFRKKALDLLEVYREPQNDIYPSCDRLIEDLSDFFIVSRSSVKYRLTEVGLIDEICKLEDYDAVFADIHESKDNGKECRHVPELMPVPRCREDTADCSETAELLNALFGEKILHLADITFQRIHTQHDTSRERLKETIFTSHRLVDFKRGNRINTHFPGRIRMQRQCLRNTSTVKTDRDILILILCKHFTHFIEGRG